MENNTIRTEIVRGLIKRIEESYAMALELGADCGIVARIKSNALIIEPYFIIDLVQRKLGVEVSTKSRKRDVVEARQVAVYLLHKYSRLSLERIAQYVNVADHSGVIYHLNKIAGYLEHDERISVLVKAFERDINDFYEKKHMNESNGL
jgi:hypothetical protein